VIPRAVPMGYSQQPYDRCVGAVTAAAEDGATETRGFERSWPAISAAPRS